MEILLSIVYYWCVKYESQLVFLTRLHILVQQFHWPLSSFLGSNQSKFMVRNKLGNTNNILRRESMRMTPGLDFLFIPKTTKKDERRQKTLLWCLHDIGQTLLIFSTAQCSHRLVLPHVHFFSFLLLSTS